MGFDMTKVRIGGKPPSKAGATGMKAATRRWLPVFDLAIKNAGEWVSVEITKEEYDVATSRLYALRNHYHRAGVIPDDEWLVAKARTMENGSRVWWIGYRIPEELEALDARRAKEAEKTNGGGVKFP
jgi:chloramphenicol 3-O-phosphotransferase